MPSVPEGEPVDYFPKGTGRPASRAFFAAGYYSVDDMAGLSKAELLELHGVGARSLTVVQEALEERGLGLRP
jgi:hypothetical protein